MKPDEIACSCYGSLRLSGAILPVVRGKVVAIGEAAGLVVPFGGAGIHTAIESAVMLADRIQADDIPGYDKAVRKRFGWLCAARKIVDSLLVGRISFFSLGTAYRALRYQGLKPTVADLLEIRRKLIRANR